LTQACPSKNFRVIDAATGVPALASRCYRFTVDP
jgi:hypothetical protein